MAYFKIEKFAGLAPAVSPRLLSDQFGQEAENINFETGRLLSKKAIGSSIKTLSNNDRTSIYRYKYGANDASEAWLQWDEDVDVVEGPIPGDTTNRLYWTGEDYPRIGWASTITGGTSQPNNSYRLGVPAPHVAVGVAISGNANDELTPMDVSYVYTYVTADGREGPPSPPSTVLERDNEQSATLTFVTPSVTSNNNLGAGSLRRIYRSNTGSTNSQFQFLAEIPISQASYLDDVEAETLGEVIPSSGWIGPPDDDSSLYPDGPLQGLINMAQGVMAGFTGKRFCLSEAFLPHAWPIAYRITTDDNIVAIAQTAGGVAALTNGQPYFITGTDPSAMSATRIDLPQACVNKHSVVDMGSYVLYAGPDGLCAVEGGAGRVITNGLITTEQWNADFDPTSLKAFKHEGTYVAFTSGGGGWVFDPRSDDASISTFTHVEVRGAYTDPADAELYVIHTNKIKKFQGHASNVETLTFKTKKFVLPKPGSMSWVSISANEYPVTVKVYGDGTLIAHYTLNKSGSSYTQTTTVPASGGNGTLAEPVMRLPAIMATEWEVEVSGTDINELCISQSLEEIKNT